MYIRQLQLNLSTMATLGTEESGRYNEVAVVERFKQRSMNGLFVRRDKKVTVLERWPLVEVWLYIFNSL